MPNPKQIPAFAPCQDVRFGSLADVVVSSDRCPLYPRKRTCALQLGMSAMGQKRTSLCMSTSLVLGLLRNWRRRCRSHSCGLDYDFTVLRPAEVWCFGRFRIKRARGISFEFAFIPLFANTEIKCPRQNYGRTPFVGVPMRHDLRARCELGSLNVHTGFCWVAIQDRVLCWRWAHRRFEFNFIRKFNDGLCTLTIGRRCTS